MARRGPKLRNLNGRRFGRLLVLRHLGKTDNGVFKEECQCACGKIHVARRVCLTTGKLQSCGCARADALTTHGNSRKTGYNSFKAAIARCTNVRNKDYCSYGGRGIEFRFANFEDFIDELGERPSPKHSVDRIDNDGHYEQGNIRWATQSEQMANRRSWKKQKDQKADET